MRGEATGRSLNGAVTVAPSQYSSVDVTGLTPAAAAAAAAAAVKRRETTVVATDTEVPGQCIRLDELAPVLEDPADD